MINSAASRGLRWLIKKIGIETIVPFSLLILTFLSLVFGLQNILRRIDENNLAIITLTALLMGWLLGKSRVKNPYIVLIAVTTGFLLVLIHTLNLWALLILIVTESISYAWRALRTLAENSVPDPSTLALLWGDISLKVNSLLANIYRWVFDLFSGAPNYDIQVVNFLWGYVLWLAASWAAWWYRRTRRALASLLPAGILLASSLSFTRGSVYFLVPMIAGLFFFLAWDQFFLLRAEWQKRKTDVAEDIAADIVMWVSAISLTIIILSLLVSVLSPQKLLRTFREFAAQNTGNTQEIGDALGLEVQASGSSYGYLEDPGVLPRSHLIGSPPELSKQLALIVQMRVQEDEEGGRLEQRYRENLYFKSIIFDQYTGRGWRTTPTRQQQFAAGDILLEEQAPGTLFVSQTFEFGIQPGGVLYYTGDPFQVNQAFLVESRNTDSNNLDIYALKSQNTSDVDRLEIVSLLLFASEAQLRAAKQEYPQWILERYLQLPEDLPEQVHELARQITQDLPTAYDKARAIETYLRGFPYSLEIPPPPSSGDISAYFLFELKSGYCDYYATAMTVLARSAGIPARLVTGYASGRYNTDEQRYTISAADAHSWVEIYFPGIGWIEFEPTAGLESIPLFPDLAIEEIEGTVQPLITERRPSVMEQRWILLPAAIAGLFLMVVLLSGLEKRRLDNLSPSQTAMIIYQRFIEQAKHLGIPSQPYPTPNEWLSDFLKNPEIQSQDGVLSRLFKHTEVYIQAIIQNYIIASYSPSPPDQNQQSKVIQAWLSVRTRLLVARIWKKFDKRFFKKLHR